MIRWMSWQPSWPLKSTGNWKLSNTLSHVKIHLIIFQQLLSFAFLAMKCHDILTQMKKANFQLEEFLKSHSSSAGRRLCLHLHELLQACLLLILQGLLIYMFSISSNSGDLIHIGFFVCLFCFGTSIIYCSDLEPRNPKAWAGRVNIILR